ncbi:ubiquinone biosynthesis accessory factor UbiJ [Paraferrimonas haliotis]|uniref:Ubiquinone biosynthesis accessory factor UbiJ n=1 Tax=Paraferrimonas haliotis TaxID=2013866 RepID=A0AA37WVM3_9GAMM|nr:SCP2 sterol-binding domain-containing protein [Paraferrimonas haliotis]GLS82292.1 DUF1243 domain-containing protein [Paraferrimonas haliotis]
MLFASFACEVAEQSINWALAQHRGSQQLFSKLSGQVIKLRLSELPWPIYLLPSSNRVQLMTQYGGDVDVAVSLPLSQAQALSDGGQITALIKSGQLELEGDIAVLQQFANDLKQLDVDWLAPLANVIGEAPAHKVSQQSVTARENLSELFNKGKEEAKHLLSDELQLAPTHSEFEQFRDEVDALAGRLQRLERKLRQLNS